MPETSFITLRVEHDRDTAPHDIDWRAIEAHPAIHTVTKIAQHSARGPIDPDLPMLTPTAADDGDLCVVTTVDHEELLDARGRARADYDEYDVLHEKGIGVGLPYEAEFTVIGVNQKGQLIVRYESGQGGLH